MRSDTSLTHLLNDSAMATQAHCHVTSDGSARVNDFNRSALVSK